MVQNVTVNDIFPTPIWAVDLSDDDALAMNAYLMREIEALMTPRPMLPPGANWQTDPTIQKLPQFADLVQFIEKAGRATLEFLQIPQRDLVITGMWANLNPPGGRNTWHSHPNNFLAAVYYIATPGNDDKIVFEDPRLQAGVMMPKPTKFTLYTGNNIMFKVKPGRLVMFPAWLKHSVPDNRSKQERISVAANLMFQNYVADASPAMWDGTVPIDPAVKG